MNRPRFLADEDLHGDIVRAVRRLAPTIEITTVVEEGLQSAPDGDILEFAWESRWLVVSHDVRTLKDAAERRIASGAALHGVFLAAQHRTVREIADSLMLIAAASSFEEWHTLITFLPI